LFNGSSFIKVTITHAFLFHFSSYKSDIIHQIFNSLLLLRILFDLNLLN
jgi:hypothetical protein